MTIPNILQRPLSESDLPSMRKFKVIRTPDFEGPPEERILYAHTVEVGQSGVAIFSIIELVKGGGGRLVPVQRYRYIYRDWDAIEEMIKEPMRELEDVIKEPMRELDLSAWAPPDKAKGN